MSTAVQSLSALAVCIGMAAFTVDIGLSQHWKYQLQAATDSGAIAAGISLLHGETDESEWQARAKSYAEDNGAGNFVVTVDLTDVKRGRYSTGTGNWKDDDDGTDVFVRGTSSVPTAFSGALALFAGGTDGDDLEIETVSISRFVIPTTCTIYSMGDTTINGGVEIYGYDSTVNDSPKEDDVTTQDLSAGICSNADVLDINGSSGTFDVNVRPGVDGTVEATEATLDAILGTTQPLPYGVDYPEPDVNPAGCTDITTLSFSSGKGKPVYPFKETGGKITVANGAWSIPAGKYCIPAEMVVNATVTLNFLGPVELYTASSLTINGGASVNGSADPHDLQIFAKGDVDVSFSGNSDFYGYVYAPQADVTIGGSSDWYGAAITGTTTLNGGGGGQIFMDTSLMDDEIEASVRLIR